MAYAIADDAVLPGLPPRRIARSRQLAGPLLPWFVLPGTADNLRRLRFGYGGYDENTRTVDSLRGQSLVPGLFVLSRNDSTVGPGTIASRKCIGRLNFHIDSRKSTGSGGSALLRAKPGP